MEAQAKLDVSKLNMFKKKKKRTQHQNITVGKERTPMSNLLIHTITILQEKKKITYKNCFDLQLYLSH